jgi:hypothetical protein
MVTSAPHIDWTDAEDAARLMAGNWRRFECFFWHRGCDLSDADRWCIWYTSSPQSGLLEQSNEKVINERLAPFAEGDDPDVVFETHRHWAVGHLSGVSIRAFRGDGSITPAFCEFCRIREALETYPILCESHYSEIEYQATLENYASEMWRERKTLPEGWEGEVFQWFSDHGHDRYTESRDDQGGYAPREAIIMALTDLGLWPNIVVEN